MGGNIIKVHVFIHEILKELVKVYKEQTDGQIGNAHLSSSPQSPESVSPAGGGGGWSCHEGWDVGHS